MTTLIRALFLSLLLIMGAANAADLPTAKAQGLIGEQRDGYLGLVQGDSPEDVKTLVAQVNAQRKSHFVQIAAKNNIAEAEAARIFAREAAERTQSGNFIQNATGAWTKK